MNRPHSHRNLLWSDNWPVVFHKQTGTLLYSLFVSWAFFAGKVTEEWRALQCVFYRMLTEEFPKGMKWIYTKYDKK